ncbi:MAG: DEAD/DEAH box helicase [Thermoanaerobaculia bacterium]|nr:DEAD/DEAH box helicase [Thermoanaerobaculia bacterium]
MEEGGQGFVELGIGEDIVEILEDLGFQHPTPIQSAVIPLALEDGDIVGLAQTGSGKTAAFGLPILETLEEPCGVQALVLCPTREIALQTTEFLETVGGPLDIHTVAVLGGVSIGQQIRKLKQGADIVVATPGRLLDHMRRGTVELGKLRELVLDEADHMLDLGFLPQIRDIIQGLPESRRTMMFSATMPPAIERLTRMFLKEPRTVDLRPTTRTAEGIEHRLYLVDNADKKACLLALVAEEEGSILVFMRRRVDAEWAARQLSLEGHAVERLHSDRRQTERQAALGGFKSGKFRILVATDLAARGIDIPAIEHIINFDPPETVEDYVHRAGRTARGTLGGTVSTIATWRNKSRVRDIETAIGQELPRCTAPGVEPWVEAARTRRGKKFVRRRLS